MTDNEWFVEQRSEVNDRVQVSKRRLTEAEDKRSVVGLSDV